MVYGNRGTHVQRQYESAPRQNMPSHRNGPISRSPMRWMKLTVGGDVGGSEMEIQLIDEDTDLRGGISSIMPPRSLEDRRSHLNLAA